VEAHLKKRLDELLVERGIAGTRRQALAILLSGVVLVDGQKEEKGGSQVEETAEIRLTSSPSKYVSRGGFKLEGALKALELRVTGFVCLDLGASTGGFTDCLLQAGAQKVFAFDVGTGLLNWRIQQDPRVIVRDRYNVRHLTPAEVGQPVDLIVGDLSFISVKQILQPLRAFEDSSLLLLIKPQFEAERDEVEKGGLISDSAKQLEILERVKNSVKKEGYEILGELPSPILGRKGNQEFFLYLKHAKV
jgi:23S rRNA (cytidine1920-2'-O)/16S rRNA (cytidine1409-2'-O)-methyltransferase